MRTSRNQASSPRSSGGEVMVLYLIVVCLGEFTVWIFCMSQQIATTHDSVFGLLQGGTLVPSNLSAAQIILFYQSTSDKYNRIAYAVAFVTQIIFLGSLAPFNPVHNRWLRRIVVLVFFILEVTSDLWYSAATGTTIGGAFAFVFNLGGGGWLASLSYVVAMAAGSTLLGAAAFHRLQKIISIVRSRAAA